MTPELELIPILVLLVVCTRNHGITKDIVKEKTRVKLRQI